MLNAIAHFRALVRDDKGQDLIEYALIACLISIVAIVAIGDVGTEVDIMWKDIVAGLQTVP
jgi:Flp pilus assembly pilin Flp